MSLSLSLSPTLSLDNKHFPFLFFLSRSAGPEGWERKVFRRALGRPIFPTYLLAYLDWAARLRYFDLVCSCEKERERARERERECVRVSAFVGACECECWCDRGRDKERETRREERYSIYICMKRERVREREREREGEGEGEGKPTYVITGSCLPLNLH